MTPRSWVMNRMAVPWVSRISRSSGQDLRLHGDVERRRRLVGDQELGLERQAHRDHHALLHAARELVGIVPRAPLGVGNVDRAQQAAGGGRAPP